MTINFSYFTCFFLTKTEIIFTLSPTLIFNFLLLLIYKTSEANETILEKFLSRISRAIGPKTRVPRGLFSIFTITAALSSNRIYIPSERRIVFAVRTIIALTISDFLIGILGIASLTTPIIVSPIFPYFWFPPKTRTHIIFLRLYYQLQLILFVDKS